MVVTAEDVYGNTDLTDSKDVTLALANNPDDATLGGTLSVPAALGLATFAGLTLDKAGTGFTLQATSDGIPGATTTTNPITVGTAAVAQLVLMTEPPPSVPAGMGFGLIVAAEDAFGNFDPSFGGSVTLALAGNPTNNTLGGMPTLTTDDGTATFSDLSLTKATSGVALEATSGSLTSATTSSIMVTAGPATQLVVTTQPPSSVTAGSGFGLVAVAEDEFGNVDPDFAHSVILALASARDPRR